MVSVHIVYRQQEEIMVNYNKVKADILKLIAEELAKRTPASNVIEKSKQTKAKKQEQAKPKKRSLSL